MKFNVITDPTGKLKEEGANPKALIPACGYLLGWAANHAAMLGGQSLKESMSLQYQMPMMDMRGGEVLEDGTFHYEGDPDLPPLVKIEAGDEHMYIYQYAIVAFSDGTKVRMD